MRYAIIGSRTFLNYDLLCSTLDKHFISQVVSGGARGADTLGVQYAVQKNIPYIEFLPEYETYGKKAPFVRNRTIVKNSDIVVAFWDGFSTGTKHAMNYATSLHKKVIVVNFVI